MTTVAEIGRMLVRAGLVEAFGHVSQRDGEITTVQPLAGGATVALDGPPDPLRPLEAPMHRAVYAARPGVGAICRTHSPAVVAWGVRAAVPPLLHGLGALAGSVAVHDDPQLVDDASRAAAAATALGEHDCLLLRANGALVTGADLSQAAVRAWFLEERARVALDAGASARALAPGELRQRTVHSAAEARRAWRWLADRFGDPPTDQGGRLCSG
jgi:ribulose-5-phosphate 4-epimerase/fuculose-1-phosphate aldolase